MMPMADVFGADINFSSARDVYPTASGGTTSSAAGAMTANTNVMAGTSDGGATTVAGGTSFTTSGRSLWWWVGFLVFLLTMVFVARKAGGEEDFRNIRPTMYNFLTITLTAIVGIVGLKTIAAKWRIPGASDVILAA